MTKSKEVYDSLESPEISPYARLNLEGPKKWVKISRGSGINGIPPNLLELGHNTGSFEEVILKESKDSA